jgi:ActR/RegA family two-component response regulator
MGILPFLLTFFFIEGIPLVNLIMAFQAQSRHQIVISFNSSTFAAAPICVGCLHYIARPAGLAVKPRHQF